MRVSRIFQATPLAENSQVTLDNAASHYAANVLRLSMGDAITLFNGEGDEYIGKVTHADKKQMAISIEKKVEKNIESPIAIHLGQGISRGEKMDFTLQKSVELGIREITPLFSERCGVKLPPDRLEKKLQHWRSVIISACEQSGRTQIPVCHPPQSYQAWVEANDSDLNLILDPRATKKLADEKSTPKKIRLVIGPEGGFSAREIEQAIQQGFTAIQLGQRILRTETAALAAISALQYRWGDF